MFKKAFTTKSNTNVRSSDKRKLLSQFSIGSEISPKSTFSVAKVVAFNGTQMNVYSCDKDPILFEIQDDKNLFPSVYFTWICPTCVPILLIPPQVMDFIENGADLMLPGVYLPSDYLFPEFEKDVPVAIAIYYKDTETISPIAVGSSTMSSQQMIASGMKGKGVNVLHVFRDCLWEFGSKTKPPKIALNNVYKSKDLPVNEADVANEVENLEVEDTNEPESNVENADQEVKDENTTQDMDELLTNVFLWTLKTNGSSIQLPMDAGQFYASYILKSLPPGTRIDLKKTSFKKFGNFLKVVNEGSEPLVKIVSKKGVDSISEFNLDNERVKNAQAVKGIIVEQAEAQKTDHSRVSECFSITEAVVSFFKLFGFKRGDIVQPNQVREAIIQYGTSNNLLTEDKKKIELDDLLQTLVRHFFPDKIGLNELVQKIGSQMTKSFVVTLPDGRRNVRREKIPLIQFHIEKRSGNKVVTLINNTTFYGIDASAFCKKVQVALATSASINQDVPNCEGPQILLSGNHVFYLGELLQNEFGIQKKYIKGLELGVKPKKAKR